MKGLSVPIKHFTHIFLALLETQIKELTNININQRHHEVEWGYILL